MKFVLVKQVYKKRGDEEKLEDWEKKSDPIFLDLDAIDSAVFCEKIHVLEVVRYNIVTYYLISEEVRRYMENSKRHMKCTTTANGDEAFFNKERISGFRVREDDIVIQLKGRQILVKREQKIIEELLSDSSIES